VSRASRGATVRILLGTDDGGLPLHARLYQQLRAHIVRGALRPGSRLPSARTLAGDLRISRNTVDAAYAQLTTEGFVTRRVGAGTIVASTVRESAPFTAHREPRIEAAREHGETPALSRRGQTIARLGLAEIEEDRMVTPGATDTRGFPSDAWQRVLSRRVRDGGAGLLRSADPFGLRALREAAADAVRLSRGVRCDASQVLIVGSTQQAIDLTARLLLDPGEVVCMEDPGYPGARAGFAASGARVVPVPVDADGVVVDALVSVRGARMAYVTPSHQYPLGVTLSLARRLALLDWARRQRAWIVEDDYDSEFRYDGRPLAALQGLDEHARVLYVGTWNKVLFNGLRLAYMVVPPELVEPVAAARRLNDGFSSPMLQAAVADFLVRGHFASYLRQARAHYELCRDALVTSVLELWGAPARIGPHDTGLHVVVHLPDGIDDARLARRGVGHGLVIAPLSRHYAAPTTTRGLLISFGGATPESVRAGIAAMAPRVAAAVGAASTPSRDPR
jgi:GntR family transcriptional regulator / MocR family aminotransferase